jgi:hypothetical protein
MGEMRALDAFLPHPDKAQSDLRLHVPRGADAIQSEL